MQVCASLERILIKNCIVIVKTRDTVDLLLSFTFLTMRMYSGGGATENVEEKMVRAVQFLSFRVQRSDIQSAV